MNNASELKECRRCGGTITSEAPQGLCPRCLLLQASLATDAGSKAQKRSSPPVHEELTAAFPQLEILELIGQGGMGFVYKARQAKLDRFVAVKILPQSLAGEPAFAERFAREGRLLARLNHPNIVSIYDFGQANGFFYLLMEFVDGVNLRQAMKAGRFTPDQALAIVPKICEALQFAHTEGILHRDIKPENILLDTKGRVKIADFGIAKLMGEAPPASTLTGSGGALGTVHYMAPEQVEKPSEVDHRADIYSLGVVFYEMLTGELPIGRFCPPSESCGVDPRIDELVFRALDKKPERRPQSASEVKTQVETIATSNASQPPPKSLSSPTGVHSRMDAHAPNEPSQNAGRRRWPGWRVLAITSGVCLAVFFLVGAIWLIGRPRPRPEVSQIAPQDAPVVPDVIGGEVSTNEPFTRTVVLTRATNQVVGQSTNTWSVGIWCDTPLLPGEILSAQVRQDDGPISDTGCHSMFFTRCQPGKVSTSTSLGWYFGGVWRKEFGESEADTVATQLRTNISDRPLALTAGKLLPLFAVTNSSGHVLAGYAEFTRYVPKPLQASRGSAPKPQAILNVRRFAAYSPSIDYSVKLPPGYALRATANMGETYTHFNRSGSLRDYHTAWLMPLGFRSARDLVAQMNAQRTALETRFQELQDLGPIPVKLGQPYPLFALTNDAGAVYRAFFELVGPSFPGATNQYSATTPGPNPSPDLFRWPIPPPKPLTPQDRTPAASARIDPATGLPIRPGTDSTSIDPATGLPITRPSSAPFPMRLLRTNGTPNSIPN